MKNCLLLCPLHSQKVSHTYTRSSRTLHYNPTTMLLQPTTSKPPLYLSSHQNHFYSNSFPSGFHQNSTFPLRQAVVFTTKTNKNLLFITCSSISHVHSYGTVDYEKRPAMTWNAIYKRISMMENPHMDSDSVLNQVENEGKNLTKWEL